MHAPDTQPSGIADTTPAQKNGIQMSIFAENSVQY